MLRDRMAQPTLGLGEGWDSLKSSRERLSGEASLPDTILLASAGFIGKPAARHSASGLLLFRRPLLASWNWPKGSSAWVESALSDSTPETVSASETTEAALP
jgi:hypothetical protein